MAIVYSIKVSLAITNLGRGSAKAPFLDVSYEPGLQLNVAKPLRSGPAGALIKPLFLGDSRCQFVGFADFIIHPGVRFEIAEFRVGVLAPADIELRCRFTAENSAMEDKTILVPAEVLRKLDESEDPKVIQSELF